VDFSKEGKQMDGQARRVIALTQRMKQMLINFSAPITLTEEYDKIVTSRGYPSRAEALREHMRKIVLEHQSKNEAK
jgi:metal-responsive CopG/Arc/MetJ family transcriptional regulator